MFARIVTMPLKAGGGSDFAKVIESDVIPLLRTHKGFRDEIAMVSSDGRTAFGISFWDSKESAEDYDRSGFRDVMKVLDRVTTGSSQLQVCEVTNSTVSKPTAAAGA